MYHIFISHAWKYNEDYNKIVSWLDEAQKEGLLTWSNYSVPEHDPLINPDTTIGKNKLKEMLKNQIKPANIILVISGMYAAYSDWIGYEIDTSVDYNKYIIGVKPWGQQQIPAKVTNNADELVGWNKNSLINAITSLR